MTVVLVGKMVKGSVQVVTIPPVMGYGPQWTTRRVLAGLLRRELVRVPQFCLRIVLGQPAHQEVSLHDRRKQTDETYFNEEEEVNGERSRRSRG